MKVLTLAALQLHRVPSFGVAIMDIESAFARFLTKRTGKLHITRMYDTQTSLSNCGKKFLVDVSSFKGVHERILSYPAVQSISPILVRKRLQWRRIGGGSGDSDNK